MIFIAAITRGSSTIVSDVLIKTNGSGEPPKVSKEKLVCALNEIVVHNTMNNRSLQAIPNLHRDIVEKYIEN